MSPEYVEYAQSLGVPQCYLEIMSGNARLPLSSWVAPAKLYGFPPAMIPFFSDHSGPSYYGLWKHWCCSRTPSFVTMFIEPRHQVVEIARTPDQFACHLILQSLVDVGRSTNRIRNFASDLGVLNYQELLDYFDNYGDDPEYLHKLPQFNQNRPLVCYEEGIGYEGDFPTGNFDCEEVSWAQSSSSLELESSALDSWPPHVHKPSWLAETSQRDPFESFLETDDVRSAWLCLNSSEWGTDDATESLMLLGAKLKIPQFDLLVHAWLSVVKRFDSGY